MRALIERQLYQPMVVLPLLLLMRLMVTLDFNLAQVMLVMMFKGSQHVYQFALRYAARRDHSRKGGSDAIVHIVCRNCC
jgi:type IV secretory pathway VirB3-like protein